LPRYSARNSSSRTGNPQNRTMMCLGHIDFRTKQTGEETEQTHFISRNNQKVAWQTFKPEDWKLAGFFTLSGKPRYYLCTSSATFEKATFAHEYTYHFRQNETDRSDTVSQENTLETQKLDSRLALSTKRNRLAVSNCFYCPRFHASQSTRL